MKKKDCCSLKYDKTNIQNIFENQFILSCYTKNHPLQNDRKEIKQYYYAVLEYIIKNYGSNNDLEQSRLIQYQHFLIDTTTVITLNDQNAHKYIRSIMRDNWEPWRNKYHYSLLCDIGLIIWNKNLLSKIHYELNGYLTKKQSVLWYNLLNLFYNNEPIPKIFDYAKELIYQFRSNQNFISLKKNRILVTANMSSGKSTLINALLGKSLTKTSQEVCTGNLCYLHNKPYEDDMIHSYTASRCCISNYQDFVKPDSSEENHIASYFRTLVNQHHQICIIDTPGVNSMLNKEHEDYTKNALVNENFDWLIYVLNANKLGTNEEMQYLNYISQNVPKEKTIFVLNKIDDFKSEQDSIADSIHDIKSDLYNLGYENPIICPLSAYFALLLKKKQNDDFLTKDEQDIYAYYCKKFNTPEFNMGQYSNNIPKIEIQNIDEFTLIAIKSGIYELENILFGGTVNEESKH